MNPRRNKSWRRSAGTTLVEAVAGVVLLGTLMTMVLMAKVKLTGQSVSAQSRLTACKVMDELLDDWWAKDQADIPRNGDGDVANREGWTWQTHAVARPDASAVHAEIVVVNVFPPGERNEKAGASVELMLPVQENAKKK